MDKVLEMHAIQAISSRLANDQVDFDLEYGEIHALVGENGSEIHVNEHPLWSLPARRWGDRCSRPACANQRTPCGH